MKDNEMSGTYAACVIDEECLQNCSRKHKDEIKWERVRHVSGYRSIYLFMIYLKMPSFA